MKCNTIKISQCDNQLRLLAISKNNSFLLCNINCRNLINTSIIIQILEGDYFGPVAINGVTRNENIRTEVMLPADEYHLIYTGVNVSQSMNFQCSFGGHIYKPKPYFTDFLFESH